MKTPKLFAIFILAISTSAIALAQPGAEDPQRQASRAQLEAARAELDAVRAELERAAQEVARLSAEQYAEFGAQGFPNINVYRFGRPLLGLNIDNDDDGVRVIGVSPGGPAEESGVEIGDLIVAINDVEVDGSVGGNSTRRFLDVLDEAEPGSEVELGLLRDGEPLTLTVATHESNLPVWVSNMGENFSRGIREIPRYAERNIVRVMEQPFFFGPWSDMELVELTPELGAYFGTETGLLIVRAPEGDEVELRDGDVILEIGGRTPQSVGHAMRILRSFEPDETLEITIMREQRRRSVDLSR